MLTKRILIALAAALLLVCAGACALPSVFVPEETTAEESTAEEITVIVETPTDPLDDPGRYLRIVNKYEPLPKDFYLDLIDFGNGVMVDRTAAGFLEKMFAEAAEQNVFLCLTEGYRTAEEQSEMMDSRIKKFTAAGYKPEAASEEAKKWVATPGTSEHQLGFAMDINQDTTTKTTAEQAHKWLLENAWRYGFIKRYPEDKVKITGISNEPWHYRFVGLGPAKDMHESGMCLEEYMSGV